VRHATVTHRLILTAPQDGERRALFTQPNKLHITSVVRFGPPLAPQSVSRTIRLASRLFLEMYRMATFSALSNPSSAPLRRSVRGEWIPVLFALILVAFTSTSFMGGSHTGDLVSAVWRAVFGNWHFQWAYEANLIGRKVGHFLGYGAIGLLFRKAWYATMRLCHRDRKPLNALLRHARSCLHLSARVS
jgi:hypothetical protein